MKEARMKTVGMVYTAITGYQTEDLLIERTVVGKYDNVRVSANLISTKYGAIEAEAFVVSTEALQQLINMELTER